MYRFFSLAIILIALNGCASPAYQHTNFSHYDTIPENKAVVMFGGKVTAKYKAFFFSSAKDHAVEPYLHLAKNKDLSKNPNSKMTMSFDYWDLKVEGHEDNFGYNAQIVDPGDYHITAIYANFPGGGGAFKLTTPYGVTGLDTNNEPLYASFSVKAGDIVYLGDLNIRILYPFREDESDYDERMYLEYNIEDHFEQAVPYIKQQFPRIKGDVKKALFKKGSHQHLMLIPVIKAKLEAEKKAAAK
ncbi:hypothetical protein [Terasakiella pusilla]|uniref:hypothetical protein n=1 Tax=Terasakiella pusilla TaxID=64973 RepID=UPI003AA83E9E